MIINFVDNFQCQEISLLSGIFAKNVDSTGQSVCVVMIVLVNGHVVTFWVCRVNIHYHIKACTTSLVSPTRPTLAP